MRSIRAFLRRLAGLFSQPRWEREIAAELESHLELHIADNVRSGMSPQEARRVALLKLGGLSVARETYRDRATLPALENLLLDLRFAVRQFARNPAFAVTAILVLSLGICAASAIFAFVDAALIKPLPYKDPARLLAVDESTASFPRNNLSYFDYLDWKRLNTTLASLDVYKGTGYLLKTSGAVEPVNAAAVSAGFFDTLGVAPALGRFFHAGEDLRASPLTVVLTYAFWQKHYGGSRGIIGRPVILSGEQYTIVGVLPAAFQFAPRGDAQLWTALHPSTGCDTRRSCHDLDGIARLKPSVSPAAALTELKAIALRLERQYPDSNRGASASLEPLSNIVVGPLGSILLMLMGGALLLLLIAVVNVVSLLLVRSESRRQEIAVRASLGASRGRIVMQFLTEGIVLIAASLVFGLAGAQVAASLLLRLIPANMLAFVPFLSGIGLNLHVLAFASLISLLSALCFALTPLLLTSARDHHAPMSEGGRWSAGLSWRRLGSKLVVVEFATALVLLIGAGLLAKSLYLLLHVDIGFQSAHLAAVSIAAMDVRYAKDPQQIALARALVSEVSALPGVRGAALTSVLPVTCNCNTDWIRVVGKPFDGRHSDVLERDVSSDYLHAIGATLLEGRYFTDSEDESQPNVVIVNQTFARKYFPGEDPIGRRIGDLKLTPKSLRQIVGVVADLREGSLEEDIWPAEYLPINQDPDSYFYLVVHTSQDERAFLPELSAMLRRKHPDLGISEETSISDQIANSLSAYLHRSSSWLVGGFAALALILSVIGLYGVVAYSVSRRRREIGVRMALGAQAQTVYWMVLREAGWLICFGIVAGVLASIGVSRILRQMLFNVRPWDAPTLVEVSALLAIAALLATFAPARRAALVNPVDALRSE
ncbi:MAG: ABC transporter permease [Acidobacteriaceae bacterium]|nr:ABC transporter permease [Acidobacteriaceae bacterium]